MFDVIILHEFHLLFFEIAVGIMPLDGCNRCGSSCFPAGAICDLILLIRQIVCFLLRLKLRLGQRIGLLLFPEPGFLQFPLKLTIIGRNGIGHVII